MFPLVIFVRSRWTSACGFIRMSCYFLWKTRALGQASSFLRPLSPPSLQPRHCEMGIKIRRKKKKKKTWKSFSTALTHGELVLHPEIQQVLREPGRQILVSTGHQAPDPAKGLQTMELSKRLGGSAIWTCYRYRSASGRAPIRCIYKPQLTRPLLMRFCWELKEALLFLFFSNLVLLGCAS